MILSLLLLLVEAPSTIRRRSDEVCEIGERLA